MTTIAMAPTMTPTRAPTGNPLGGGARGDGGGVGGEGGELGGGGTAGEGGGARGVMSGEDGGTAVASGAQCWACTPIAAHARPHHRSKNGSLPEKDAGISHGSKGKSAALSVAQVERRSSNVIPLPIFDSHQAWPSPGPCAAFTAT